MCQDQKTSCTLMHGYNCCSNINDITIQESKQRQYRLKIIIHASVELCTVVILYVCMCVCMRVCAFVCVSVCVSVYMCDIDRNQVTVRGIPLLKETPLCSAQQCIMGTTANVGFICVKVIYFFPQSRWKVANISDQLLRCIIHFKQASIFPLFHAFYLRFLFILLCMKIIDIRCCNKRLTTWYHARCQSHIHTPT